MGLDGAVVKAVHAYNIPGGSSTRKVHHRGECVGYLIAIEGKTIYHAGDTDLIPEMAGLGRVDLAFLPIGGTFTMDLGDAMDAVKVIKPETAVPINHLKTDPLAFKRQVESETNSSARVLRIGEEIVL